MVISVLLLAALLAGTLIMGWGQQTTIPEIDTSRDPIQKPYEGVPVIVEDGGRKYTIVPVASYEISAKVVGLKTYDDVDSKIIPIDICLVWGELALESNISYTQKERRCYPMVTGPLKISEKRFGDLSNYKLSNNHIIPANDNISNTIRSLKINDRIILKGFLTDIYGDDGRYVKTSLSRYDILDSACEIIYVTEIKSRASLDEN